MDDLNDLIRQLSLHYYVAGTTDTEDLISETIKRLRELEAALAAEQESNAYLNNLQKVDADRIRALETRHKEAALLLGQAWGNMWGPQNWRDLVEAHLGPVPTPLETKGDAG